MRVLNLKTPVLALILAVAAEALLQALSMAVGFALRPETSINLLDRCLQIFYFPAEIIAFLCLPSSSFDKGSDHGIQIIVVFILFALIQWYLIFLAGIGTYRHFHKKHHEDIRAA
jgi:hypothetical protein